MHEPSPAGSPLMTRCHCAINQLDDALHKPGRSVGQEIDRVETLVVQMRDQIIARLRQDTNAADTVRWRRSLERLNVALSLLIGVEYPATGVQRTAIQQARDTLAQIHAEELPS